MPTPGASSGAREFAMVESGRSGSCLVGFIVWRKVRGRKKQR